MIRFIILAMAVWAQVLAAQASSIPPVEHGVWLSARMMPQALASGDYTSIADLFTPETTINADDGKVLAKGAAASLIYLKRWYGSNNRIVANYSGYASLVISVERTTDRPWDKAYMMVIRCASGKVSQIMIINRNPNMP